MPTVYVNNQPVELAEGERLNCIQAAQRAGVEIPHYCWHPELSVVASCRMCLLEVGEKKPDGTIAMQPKVVPGCQTPVKDGTVIVTDTPKVAAAQKGTLEYLLLNHPLDCPVCDQAGECGLQDYSYKYGRGVSRLKEPKNIKPDKDYIGEQITLFTDRCIMCTRCVRFTKEICGTAELQVVSRGTHEEIDIFPGQPCNNKLAGNVVDLCPVGALCSKDFLYQQRVWWLKTKHTVCGACSTGCSITADQNNDVLYRLKPRANPKAQGYFMCDEGRFGWKYQHSDRRLLAPLVRKTGATSGSPATNGHLPGAMPPAGAPRPGVTSLTTAGGTLVVPGGAGTGTSSILWEQALPAVDAALRDAAAQASKTLLGVISPWATVEEAYLLATYLKQISPATRLVLGPVRTVGQDDQYPKNIRGESVTPVRFTIRAEKCPNRQGVSAVLQHFEGRVTGVEELLAGVANGEFSGVFVLGGDPAGCGEAMTASALRAAPLLIVQDLLSNSLTDVADIVLAGAAWVEKEGTFVNHSGLAQAVQRALRGPGESRPDGRILWDLNRRTGLFNVVALRKEIAEQIGPLCGLGAGKLGSFGVQASEPVAAPAVSSPAAVGASVPAGGSH